MTAATIRPTTNDIPFEKVTFYYFHIAIMTGLFAF